MSAPGLAWFALLENTKVKLELIANYDMLMIVEMALEMEFVKQHIGMLKQTINISEIMIKTLNHDI